MITEFLFAVFGNIAGWLLEWMPENDDLAPLAGQMANVFEPLEQGLNGLGAWMPWGIVNTCAGITLGLWIVTLLIRAVKSFIPTISG
jgi:hypothetical protein